MSQIFNHYSIFSSNEKKKKRKAYIGNSNTLYKMKKKIVLGK